MSMDPPETLAALVARMRSGTKLSQGAFADRCAEFVPGVKGLNQGSISHMEKGNVTPSPEQLRAIVAAGGGGADLLSRGLSLLVGVPVVVSDDAAPVGPGSAAVA